MSVSFAAVGETAGCEFGAAGAGLDAAVDALSGLEAMGEFPQPVSAIHKTKLMSQIQRLMVISFLFYGIQLQAFCHTQRNGERSST